MAMPKPEERFRPPSIPQVTVGGFWRHRLDAVRDQAAPAIYNRCIEAGTMDQVDPDKPVPELRIPFVTDTVTMQLFWDSDLGKIIEAFAYLLASRRDPSLEEKADAIIDKLAKLQQPDGYLNSWYQRMQPGKRWTNLRDCHELYNVGHLLEGAVAYYQATGKRQFLDVMIRCVDHIASIFGPEEGKKKGYCGHEEIELALVKLYRATGEKRFLDLSKYFIDQRGQQPNYFELEAKERSEKVNNNPSVSNEYNQSHKPVREQDKVVGHAVRAMYLYCGMADVALETGDESLKTALEKLWEDLTSKRLYITGGMGPSADNEGFTADYDFPNESAYAETCAAIGFVFWAHRMLGFGPDRRYSDMMELALYNGAQSGISLDGSRFFYENPLESRGAHHRWLWHRCPCCPSNISRLIGSLGTYIYGQSKDGIAVHLYAESAGDFVIGGSKATIRQNTRYPWDGEVVISIGIDKPTRFSLSLRIPGWSQGVKVKLNKERLDASRIGQNGYLVIDREWMDGDNVELSIPMPVRFMYAHPDIRQDVGRTAIMRGPLLYCLEGVDNPVPLNRIVITPDAVFKDEFRPNLLGGVVALTGTALADDSSDWKSELYRPTPPKRVKRDIVAVPYYAWDNREPGEMLVWLRKGTEWDR